MADRIERWQSKMHPDDRKRVREAWLKWIPQQQPFETQFRILWADGNWHRVRIRARLYLDDEGKAERWYGIISDLAE